MIAPATNEVFNKQIKSRLSLHIYHVCALVISLANFIPLIIYWQGSQSHFVSAGNRVVYLFHFSCVLALPLMLEFILDNIVSTLYPAYLNNQTEHKLGHFLIILSLGLPVVLTIIHSSDHQISSLLSSCFLCFCQALAVGGIIGKLQVFCSKYWHFVNCMGIFVLYSASQIAMNFGVATCETETITRECHLPISCIVTSLVLDFLCLIIFALCCKPYVEDSHESISFTSNQYTSCVLILILGIYILSRLILMTIRSADLATTEQISYGHIVFHIFLALCATVLPGRMIRRGMVALKREMDSKKTFIRYISHEIRSPLSTTSLGLDYLIAQLSSGENNDARIEMSFAEILDVVTDAKATCELATNTLNDLLMFDKIETGMLQLATTEVDAWEFVNDCVKPFNLQALTSGIDMQCNYLCSGGDSECGSEGGSLSVSDRGLVAGPGMVGRLSPSFVDIETGGESDDNGIGFESSPPKDQFELVIKVDKYKMDQVVRNFLTNALKFTPQHSTGAISIDVSVQDAFSSAEAKEGKKNEKKKATASDRYTISDRKKVLRVTVTDNGPSISKENLPKLFGQYVQFDANTLQGGKGSGLGLWLSKAIVEMHGGVIGATSPGVGLGCSFFLEIPCTKSSLGSNSRTMASTVELTGRIIRLRSQESLADVSATTKSNMVDGISEPIGTSKTQTLQHPQSTALKNATTQEGEKTAKTVGANSNSVSSTGTFRPVFTAQQPLLTNVLVDIISDSRSAESSYSIRSRNENSKRSPSTGVKTQQYRQLIQQQQSTDQVLTISEELKPHRDHFLNPTPIVTSRAQEHIDADKLPDPIHILRQPMSKASPKIKATPMSKRSPNNHEPMKRHAPAVDGSNYPLTGLRVLLVDDSSIARKMMERMLSAVGCVCDHACNGQEAVNIIADQMADLSLGSYDVILMDCYMPVMNGPEAVNIIRDRGFKGHILAVTGASTDGEFAPLLAEGLVERIVIKPFNAENFRHIVFELNHHSK